MDIKVGNDIKLNVLLPHYIDYKSIVNAKAILNKIREHKPCDFYHPSEYTIMNSVCGGYNVNPVNESNCCHKHDHCCDHRHRHSEVVVKLTDTRIINVFFSNTTIHDCGKYELAVKIRVREDGWDCDNVHEYTVYYGPVFSISVDSNAFEGDITIDVNKNGTNIPENDEESVLLYNDDSDVLYNDYTKILLNESKNNEDIDIPLFIINRFLLSRDVLLSLNKADNAVLFNELKTINGISLIGSGDIHIDGASGGYAPPTGGIPKSDLSRDVLSSLNKADTALQPQSLSEYIKSSEISDWAKQSNKPSYTASEVGALSSDTILFDGNYNSLTNKPTVPAKTSQLTNDSSFATETYVAAEIAKAKLDREDIDLSAYALKTDIPSLTGYAKTTDIPTKVSLLTNDSNYLTSHLDLSGKQDVISDLATIRSGAALGATSLQSHQPLKTINGQTIAGTGDITIYEVVEDTESTNVTLDVVGGKMYKYGALESLNIQSIENSNLESVIEFTTAESFTVTLPDTYQSIGEISLEGGKSYIISIMNGVLVSGEVSTITA